MSGIAGLVGGVGGAFIGNLIFPGLGAAIGWAVGAFVGNLLFPTRVEGPKLENLKLQVSTYGQMIPIVYGTMRIAGNVIWATDLQPHTHGGGKGGSEPETTTYTASFAVLICEGPIVSITRIWALGETIWPDGNSPIPCTVYLGTQTQLPDPTIEAEEGVGNVPAHRGYCYVVFPDYELERYGNALPILNFEVVTSAGYIPWRVSTWIPPQSTGGGETWSGYSTSGASIGTDGSIIMGIYTQLNPLSATGQQYTEYTFDTEGTQLSASTPVALVNQPSNVGDNRRMFAIPCANAQIAFCFLAFQGLDSGASSWFVGSTMVAWPVAPAIGTNARYACQSQPFLYNAPDPFDNKIFVIGGSTANGLWVARYPAPNGIPQGGVDAYYEFTTDPGQYQVTVSDDGFVYVLGPGIVTVGHTWALAKFDLDLNLIYQWDDGDLPANAKGNVYQFTVYNGMIFWETGSGNCDLYSLNGDRTFTLIGTTPTAVLPPGEGYPLISFGNGLVLARDGVLSLIPPPEGTTYGAVFADISRRCDLLSSQVDVTAIPEPLDGFVINQQQPGRDCALPLQSADYFDVVESSGIMKCVKRGGAPVVSIPDDDLAATTNPDEAAPLSTYKRIKEADLPAILNVKYINAENDYEVGQQSERRQVTSSEQTRTIELPIRLTDAKARQVAKALMYSAWFEREPEVLRTSRKYAYLEPTDVVTARGGDIRIMQKSDEASNVVQFDGVPSIANIWTSAPIAGSGSGFRPSHPPTSQTTQLLLLDIPLVTDADTPGFYAAMAGTINDTWRGAQLYQSVDGGVTWNVVAASNTPSTIGTCSNALQAFSSNIFDEGSVLHVVIGNGGGTLASATEMAVLAGANTCLFGNEIGSFKVATLTAPGEYDLSGWLRGRRGTEAFTGAHAVGERFVMLPVTNVPMPNSQLYHTYSYRAVTFGRPLAGTASQDFANTGNALKPYSPTDVGGGCDASGNVTLNCKRRTRVGGAWSDYVDVPLSESTEAYVWQIWDSSYTLCARIILTSAPTATYTAVDQVTDFGATQRTYSVNVGQIGSVGSGVQTRATVPGIGGSNNNPLSPIVPYGFNPIVRPPDPPVNALGSTLSVTWGVADSWQSWDYGNFCDNIVWVFSLAVPGGTATSTILGSFSLSEYQGPETLRQMTLSTVPGDFRDKDYTGVNGPLAVSNGTRVTIDYGVGAPSQSHAGLTAGITYYVSVRNWQLDPTPQPSCGLTTCNALMNEQPASP